MGKKPIRVAVTGAAGHIGYALVFHIAEGEMLGRNQPIILQMLELPSEVAQIHLKGVMMELDDCAFPVLVDTIATGDPKTAFRDADFAFLVGAKPRGPGMERRDLLQENAKIFIEQGRALNEVASRDVRVLTVGNPANTNSWIAMKSAPDLPKGNFTSMMRLDQSRARFKLAEKLGKPIGVVHKIAVWGNHSPSVYPDIRFSTVEGQPAIDLVDRDWYENEYIPGVAARGAQVIEARGSSSAGSAAIAAIKHMRDWMLGAGSRWIAMGIPSDGSYGIPEDVMYGVPVTCTPGKYERVKDLEIDAFSRKRMDLALKELLEEQASVKEMLKKA